MKFENWFLLTIWNSMNTSRFSFISFKKKEVYFENSSSEYYWEFTPHDPRFQIMTSVSRSIFPHQVQLFSCAWLFVTPWTTAHQVSLSITNSRTLFKTHVHWVTDAIQPAHPLSSPSPPTLNLSQHQGLFKWVSSSNQVAKVLDFSFSFSPSNEYPGLISFRWTGWISLQSKGFSRVFSNTTVQKHQFFGAQLSLEFNSHIHTWLLGKPQLWLDGTLLAK